MPEPLAVSVERWIDARPETIYDLIADITAIGEFSPETVGASWLGGATSAAVGARFKGRNAIGRLRWSTKPTVTSADPGRRFAFQVPGRGGPLWTYELEPAAAGTRVVESMKQERPSPLMIRFLQRRAGVVDRAEYLRQGMRVTLDRMADGAVALEQRATQSHRPA